MEQIQREMPELPVKIAAILHQLPIVLIDMIIRYIYPHSSPPFSVDASSGVVYHTMNASECYHFLRINEWEPYNHFPHEQYYFSGPPSLCFPKLKSTAPAPATTASAASGDVKTTSSQVRADDMSINARYFFIAYPSGATNWRSQPFIHAWIDDRSASDSKTTRTRRSIPAAEADNVSGSEPERRAKVIERLVLAHSFPLTHSQSQIFSSLDDGMTYARLRWNPQSLKTVPPLPINSIAVSNSARPPSLFSDSRKLSRVNPVPFPAEFQHSLNSGDSSMAKECRAAVRAIALRNNRPLNELPDWMRPVMDAGLCYSESQIRAAHERSETVRIPTVASTTDVDGGIALRMLIGRDTGTTRNDDSQFLPPVMWHQKRSSYASSISFGIYSRNESFVVPVERATPTNAVPIDVKSAPPNLTSPTTATTSDECCIDFVEHTHVVYMTVCYDGREYIVTFKAVEPILGLSAFHS
jgi:hypothetical protein